MAKQDSVMADCIYETKKTYIRLPCQATLGDVRLSATDFPGMGALLLALDEFYVSCTNDFLPHAVYTRKTNNLGAIFLKTVHDRQCLLLDTCSTALRYRSNEITKNYARQYSGEQSSASSKVQNYLNSDSYFHVLRDDKAQHEDVVCQLMALSHLMLADIPYADMPEHAVTKTILGVQACIKYSVGIDDNFSRTGDSSQCDNVPLDDFTVRVNDFWSDHGAITNLKQKMDVALFRWLIGHQLSFTLMLYLTVLLKALAKQVVRQAETDEAVDDLLLTASYDVFHGICGLLWYTHSFPPGMYENIIGRGIENHSRKYKSGLSGILGPEWVHFRKAVTNIMSTVSRYRGRLPEALMAMLKDIIDTELLFLENHAVLVENKISSNYISIRERIAHPANDRTAMATMRMIYARRQADIDRIFSAE